MLARTETHYWAKLRRQEFAAMEGMYGKAKGANVAPPTDEALLAGLRGG